MSDDRVAIDKEEDRREARIEYYRLLVEYRALEMKRDLYKAELDKYACKIWRRGKDR